MTARYRQRNKRAFFARSQAVAAGLDILLLLGWAADVEASPQSTALVHSGLEALAAEHVDQARERFESAVAADPNDSDAEFFVGVALNRLARATESLHHLDRAKVMGNANDDMAFETGWGLLMLGDWPRARDQLEAYERDHPGRGLTSEFLGRAYLGLKEYARSEAAFVRAAALDPDLKPSVDLYRVELAAARGGRESGTEAAERLLALAPPGGSAWPGDGKGGRAPGRYGSVGASAGPFAEPAVLPAAGSAAARPWLLELSVAAGYDSNARGLEEDIENGQAPRGAESAFTQFTLNAAWIFVNTPEQRLRVGVDVFDRTYLRGGIHSDFLDPVVYVQLDQLLSKSLSATVRISEDYTLVDYANFRSQVGARPALNWQVTPTLRLEMAYTYAFDDYLFRRPVPLLPKNGRLVPRDVLDQTGDVHTATAALYGTLPGTSLKAFGGYFHIWNVARGSDYDFQANGAFAGLTVPLAWGVTADLGYEYTLERYEHINSSTELANSSPRHRRDPIQGISVRFTKPLSPQLTAYLEYDFNVDRSNIPFFGYTGNVIGAGLTWRF